MPTADPPPDGPPYDVAVVGLGPVGAALAALVGQHELRVVALDRDLAPHSLPRAAHLDGHALRVLEEAGAPATGRPLDGFDLVDRRGRLLLRGRPAERPPPGFPPGLLVHQPTVERALRQRLAELPTVDVRLGHAVERLADDGDRVTVEGTGPAGPFSVRAALAVGCDGAGSVVRQALGGDLVGSGFEQTWLVVDAVLDPGAAVPDRLLQIADPDGPATSVPFAAPRHRWEFRLRADEDAEAARQPGAVRARLAAHVDPDAVVIERAAVYTFHDLVARPWRRGRLALAGDAAHQMPPFLGQGLGAGLRDVRALAPLLAAVIGGAPLAALDAYEAERRPHVEATVRQAVRLGRLVTLPEPWASVRDGALRLGLRLPGLGRWLRDVRG
ncbi:FAD-dependent monooxygenase [Rubrivirga sp.]|uniref:FAD-dependent monooxygenase n=1 Tax=Rubrivirga sp. TaxID=1885344 RepID=UPI003B52E6A4